MIEILTDLPAGVIGLRAGGRLTATDYDEAITPFVTDAMRGGTGLRCLIEIEPGFAGLALDAVADDVRLGLHAIGAVDGVAVLADTGWVAEATRWAAFVVTSPCACSRRVSAARRRSGSPRSRRALGSPSPSTPRPASSPPR